MNDGKRRAALRSALLRRFGQRFAALLNILRDALQAPASDLRPGNYFLDVAEGIGIVGLLAKFLNEGMDLGENEEHFAATARLQKEFFIERAVEHERRSHIPIAAHLSNPCTLLARQRTRNLYQLIGSLRPEFRRKPVPRFAHFRLAAEIVEFQNQSGIVRGRFFCHVFASLVMFQKFCFEQPYLSDLIVKPYLSDPGNVRCHAFEGALVIAFFIGTRDHRSVFAQALHQILMPAIRTFLGNGLGGGCELTLGIISASVECVALAGAFFDQFALFAFRALHADEILLHIFAFGISAARSELAITAVPQYQVALAQRASLIERNVGHFLALIEPPRRLAIGIAGAGHELAEAAALQDHDAP